MTYLINFYIVIIIKNDKASIVKELLRSIFEVMSSIPWNNIDLSYYSKVGKM